MVGGDSCAILHKIQTVAGGWLKLNISHICFNVLCFVFGILFSYIIVTDGTVDESYPVNSMTLKDVSVLVDTEAKAALNGERYEELAAISAMQIVNAIASEYRIEASKAVSSVGNISRHGLEHGWRSFSGDCYTKAVIMMQIMQSLHIPVREIKFWHIDGTSLGYAACEVYYNDSWHYFDPTWGLYFRDSNKNILSLQDILSLPKEKAYSWLVMDCSNLQNTLTDFKYSKWNVVEIDAQITIDGNSNILFDFKKNNSLSAIPSYIGILRNWCGKKCEAKYTIVVDDDMDKVNIYYTKSSEQMQIDLTDERGNVIQSIYIDEADGVITIKKEMLEQNTVILQAHNSDKYGVLQIENIEGIYKDGSVICAQ